MPVIAIERSSTSVRRSACRPTWTLDLVGPGRGRSRDRVRLVFSPSIDARPGPTVGYVTEDKESGVSVVGWLPAAEFPVYRRILDEGGPLEVHYEAREQNGAGYLRRLALGRDHEVLATRTADLAPTGKRAHAMRSRRVLTVPL